MQKKVWSKYQESHEEVIPRLMQSLKTPFKVAVEIGVYPNSVREFLIQRGWEYIDGTWVAPKVNLHERTKPEADFGDGQHG